MAVLDGDRTLLCYSIPAPVFCNEYFTNLTGVISSPNYPDNYHHDASCYYSITIPEGFVSGLTLYIENLEL